MRFVAARATLKATCTASEPVDANRTNSALGIISVIRRATSYSKGVWPATNKLISNWVFAASITSLGLCPSNIGPIPKT